MALVEEQEHLGLGIILRSFSIFLVFIAVTFLVAGRLDYWQGWVFNALNIFFLLVTFVVLHDRKDLIKERLKPGVGMKRWDKTYYMISTPLFFLMLVVSILDVARFQWQPKVSFAFMLIGIILYILGQSIILWAKVTNKFFSSVVRIQTDRGQEVCSEGPYHFIRHPGYLSGIIFTIGTPLMLGSFWGLIPAIVTVILIVGRTYLEDATLQHELAGYREYMKTVRYRLIPFIW